MDKFESKPAEVEPFKTSNSTAKITEMIHGDCGADRVGNTAENPYGPNAKK